MINVYFGIDEFAMQRNSRMLLSFVSIVFRSFIVHTAESTFAMYKVVVAVVMHLNE